MKIEFDVPRSAITTKANKLHTRQKDLMIKYLQHNAKDANESGIKIGDTE